MKTRVFKKIGFGLLLLAALGVVAELLFTRSMIRQHKGSNIGVIDPTPYATKYGVVGLRNVQVLAPENDRFVSGNVVLDGPTIQSITDVDTVFAEIEYIDAGGRFLIPGLIDSHVHLVDAKNDLYLYLANGVTTVFEMYGTDEHIRWKQEAENGAISPSLYVASRKIGSREGLVPIIEDLIGNHMNLTSRSAVEETVARHKEMGYDALKLSSYLTVEAFHQVLEAADRHDLPVLGHLAHQVGLENLFGSGMSALSHMEEIVKNTMWDFGNAWEQPDEYLAYHESRLDAIADQIAKDRIAVSTTIWLGEAIVKQKLELGAFIKTIPLQYVNAGVAEGSGMIKGWLPGNNEYEDPGLMQNPEEAAKARAYFAAYVEALHMTTEALVDRGVPVMAGTDANVPGTVPGFSLHDELQSLSALGLSTVTVLRAATSVPAVFAGRNIGTIQEGYRADLVLLSANPLEDIASTRSIEAVFFNGYSIDKGQIANLLRAVAAANDESRNIDIAEYAAAD